MNKTIRSRSRTKNRILLILMSAVLLTAACVCFAYAEPVVIKDKEKGIGVTERDRSIQDGSIIYGMTPVYPEDFLEGTYDISAVSSSQFFKITGVRMTNRNGKLEAVMTISSTSYAYVYPGTAAEAAADPSGWIPADESSGYGEFTIEAEALNKEMSCAAYSKKKEKWYDRDIVFLASDLPEDALLIEIAEDGQTIADTQEAAIQVIYIALGIIIVGGILNFFIKRKFYE